MDRALRPLRPRPFAFVTGLLGVTALVISFALAVRTPRPSTVPIDEPFAEIECGELDASIARTRAQGYTSRVRVRGALRPRGENSLGVRQSVGVISVLRRCHRLALDR